jgi:hypothetical protein
MAFMESDVVIMERRGKSAQLPERGRKLGKYIRIDYSLANYSPKATFAACT